jgi:hypothetical protein
VVRNSSRSWPPGLATSSGGGSNIEARQVGQIVCVTPAADGGAVTTQRHQAQTTVRTLAAICQPLFRVTARSWAVVEVGAFAVMNRNGDAGAAGSQRRPRADSLDVPCSILKRRVAKTVTPVLDRS